MFELRKNAGKFLGIFVNQLLRMLEAGTQSSIHHTETFFSAGATGLLTITRDVKSSSGLEAKVLASASVSASKLWPRPRPSPQTFGLGLASVCSRRTNSQEEIDGPICLHFTLPTTGHHTMIEHCYCVRENEK